MIEISKILEEKSIIVKEKLMLKFYEKYNFPIFLYIDKNLKYIVDLMKVFDYQFIDFYNEEQSIDIFEEELSCLKCGILDDLNLFINNIKNSKSNRKKYYSNTHELLIEKFINNKNFPISLFSKFRK